MPCSFQGGYSSGFFQTRIVSLGNLDHTILAYKNARMASMRIQSVLLHKISREQETICYIPWNSMVGSIPGILKSYETIPLVYNRIVSLPTQPKQPELFTIFVFRCTSSCLSHLKCLSSHFWLIGPWKKWWISIWNETADANADTQKNK